MKRLLILLVIAFMSGFNAFSEEVKIIYNENTDQQYSLTFRTLIDTPHAVEVIGSYFWGIVEVVEIPETIELYGNDFTITKVSAPWSYLSGDNPQAPIKIIFPSTVRQITTGVYSNSMTEEIVFNDSPIEKMDGFSQYRHLKSISFGNAFKAKSIGSFYSCENLVEIDIPDSVEEIKEYCFQNCHSLKNVTLPAGITTIPQESFAECSSLEKIEFKGSDDNKCSYIGRGAFRNCESLKSISLPKATKIDNEAFLNCSGLLSVILSKDNDTEINIGSYAFENCRNLTDIQYEVSQLKSIEYSAFKDCTSLESFILPSDIPYLESSAFGGCTGIEAFNVVGDGRLCSIDGVLMSRFINEFNELIRLDLIIYPAGKKDRSYVMPDEVKSIADSSFEGAIYLQDLTISDNITEIGRDLFRNNSGLIHIYGGENINRIGMRAFEGATNLQQIFSLKNVTDLGVMAFRDCKALRNVELPEGLNHIPSGTFMGCTALEDVKIPDHYIYIGKSTFQDCTSLKEVKLPDELMVLGENAFINCSKIESMVLPEKIKEIRTNTFRDCESLKSITLPASLDTIRYAALQGCKALEGIELPTSLKSIEKRAFMGCESLTSIVIPDAVTEIGTNAFDECSSLKEVTVGNGVKEIGQWAFYDCTAMEKLTLGSSLETIGAEAFDGDINLRDITCLAVNPPSFPGGFPEEVMENATVTVPEGSEDAYNSDPNWDPMVEGEVPHAESILLNFSEIELNVRESVTLTAEVFPAEAVNKEVTWTSDDYFVAKVDENGLVTAKSEGTALITATCGDAVAECVVFVSDPAGVDSLFMDAGTMADVFSTDGVLLKKGCLKEDLGGLAPGVYIVKAGNKVRKFRILNSNF